MNAAGQPGEFSKKTFKTFVLRVVTQIFGIGAGIIIARSLGPAGKGTFTYATTAFTLIMALAIGASNAVSWQYGRLKVPSGAVYAATLKFLLFVCVPLAVALIALGTFTNQFAAVAAAIAFPFAYLSQVSIGFTLADGDVTFANLQGLALAVFLTAVAAILCYGLHLGIFAMLCGWIGINAAVCVYSLVRMSKYARHTGEGTQRAGILREHSFFSLRVALNQLLSLLNYQVDIFIVLFVLGHAWLGRYSVAVGVGMMMWQLSRPLTATSYRSVTTGTPQEAARITVLCVRHAIFSVGVASVVLAVIGPWLLQLVYGPAFAASGRALQLLLPGIIAYCAVPFFAQYFTLQLGKPGLNTIVIAISTLLCAIVTLVLIHRFGILAGAIGTSVSYSAAFAICAIVFCRDTRTSPIALFAFTSNDLHHYVLLLRWMLSGLRTMYVRRAG